MPFSHTLAGTTFTEANFQGNAYANESAGLPKALEKTVEHVANAFRGTASDSVTVGTGSKVLTITNTSGQIPAFAVGMPVRIARTSDPSGTYMQGEITAWDGGTGATTANVSSSKGSGTFTDWTITLGGNVTTASASPLGISDGGTGASVASTARTALGLAIGSDVQAQDDILDDLAAISGQSQGDSIVWDGTDYVGGAYPVNRNLIINGAMQVYQRGSFAGIGSSPDWNILAVDRFKGTFYDTSSVAVATMSQVTDAPSGFGYSLKFDITTADTSHAAAYYYVRQDIEGQYLQHLKFGTANAVDLTFSFWLKTTVTGTYCAFINLADDSRGYIREFTVSSADTWEFHTVTFPGDTTGVIDNDTGNGATVGITFAGNALTAAADTWVANTWIMTTNQVNGVSSASNTILTTGWQLEGGSVATPFEHEHLSLATLKCQRYYYRIDHNAMRYLCGCYDPTNCLGDMQLHPTPMRTTPTVLKTDSEWRVSHDGTTHDSTVTFNASLDGNQGYYPSAGNMSTGTQGETYWLFYSGSGGQCLLEFDAEF